MFGRTTVLDTVESLVILIIRFTTNGVGNLCQGKQISFIGSIDKDLAAHHATLLQAQADQSPGNRAGGGGGSAIDGRVPQDTDPLFLEHRLDGGFGDVGLKGPRHVFAGLVTPSLEVAFLLPTPGLLRIVVLSQSLVKLAADSADGGSCSDIGGAKTTGGQATEMFMGRDQDHFESGTPTGDGGRDSCRGGIVNHQIRFEGSRALV